MNPPPRSRAMLIVENRRLRRHNNLLLSELYRREHGVKPLLWKKVTAGIYRSIFGDILLSTPGRWLLTIQEGGSSTHDTLTAARDYADKIWRETVDVD